MVVRKHQDLNSDPRSHIKSCCDIINLDPSTGWLESGPGGLLASQTSPKQRALGLVRDHDAKKKKKVEDQQDDSVDKGGLLHKLCSIPRTHRGKPTP